MFSAERHLRHLADFGGILFSEDLTNFSVLSFPMGFLLHTNGTYWISLVLKEDVIEVMDPLGFIKNSAFENLQLFLKSEMGDKTLISSPKIQMSSHSNCALFAITFLFWSLECKRSLLSFMELFSDNALQNTDTIETLFSFINS